MATIRCVGDSFITESGHCCVLMAQTNPYTTWKMAWAVWWDWPTAAGTELRGLTMTPSAMKLLPRGKQTIAALAETTDITANGRMQAPACISTKLEYMIH